MKIKKSDIFASCVEVHSDDGRRIIRVIKCLKGEYYTVYAIYPTVEAQECICKRCKLETAHRKATEFIAEYEAEHPAEPQQAEPKAETNQETPAEAQAQTKTAPPPSLTWDRKLLIAVNNKVLEYLTDKSGQYSEPFKLGISDAGRTIYHHASRAQAAGLTPCDVFRYTQEILDNCSQKIRSAAEMDNGVREYIFGESQIARDMLQFMRDRHYDTNNPL